MLKQKCKGWWGGPTDGGVCSYRLRQGNLRRLPEKMEFEPGLEMLPHRGVEKGGTRFQGVFWERGVDCYSWRRRALGNGKGQREDVMEDGNKDQIVESFE